MGDGIMPFDARTYHALICYQRRDRSLQGADEDFDGLSRERQRQIERKAMRANRVMFGAETKKDLELRRAPDSQRGLLRSGSW